jgi:hypothetical protein
LFSPFFILTSNPHLVYASKNLSVIWLLPVITWWSTRHRDYNFSFLVLNPILPLSFIQSCMVICKHNFEGVDILQHPCLKSSGPGLSALTAVVTKALLYTCFMLVSCSAYTSTLKMEAICPAEMLVEFQWTTQRYITGDRSLRVFCCLKLLLFSFLFNSFLSIGISALKDFFLAVITMAIKIRYRARCESITLVFLYVPFKIYQF